MPNRSTPSPARALAPLALAVFAVAFFGVILTSGSGDDGGDGGSARTEVERTNTRGKGKSARRRPTPSVYTVKVGDTLGSIAEKTGVTVERLQELNPELDPQALVSGQKIELRE
jgi:LysM repeat protein